MFKVLIRHYCICNYQNFMFINPSELRILFCVEFSTRVKLTINSEPINVYVFTKNATVLV